MTIERLKQEHLHSVHDNFAILGSEELAAKDCARISIQFAIDVLKQASGYGQSVFSDEINLDIMELQKQLSEL